MKRKGSFFFLDVSNLDTRDPGSCRPEMCPTWTPGIQGAAGRECVQLGHRGSRVLPAENVSNLDTAGSWVLPAGNVSNLDTRDPGSHRPGMCPTWTPGIQVICRPQLFPAWLRPIPGKPPEYPAYIPFQQHQHQKYAFMAEKI